MRVTGEQKAAMQQELRKRRSQSSASFRASFLKWAGAAVACLVLMLLALWQLPESGWLRRAEDLFVICGSTGAAALAGVRAWVCWRDWHQRQMQEAQVKP